MYDTLIQLDSYVAYYEQQIKRELKGIHICGCRYNERLKATVSLITFVVVK